LNRTSFLYPFLEAGERDPQELLAELARSAHQKMDDSSQLIDRSLAGNEVELENSAAAIMTRIRAGGSLLTFGNGGSACDALAFVRRLDGLHGVAIGARSLSADPVVLSALANDIGTEQIFSRQIEAVGRPSDVAVGFSTSGQSTNVLSALAVARKQGMLTVAFAGYHGGSMAENADVDHCLIVESDSVHRIQEAQTCLASRLCTMLADLAANTTERL
jgi:D-sedoheptulose 7-phosphate isomerase